MTDLLAPELHATGEADAALDALRARCPVAWQAGRHGPGYWAVTGHAELVAVARDPAAFTSYLGTRPEVRRTPAAARPLHNLDPPAHTRLRARANRLVAPARLAALAPVIAAAAATAIDAFVAAGGGDAIPAIAARIPAEVFAAWLGLPAADAPLLAARVDAVHAAGAALLDAQGAPALRTAAATATAALADWLHAEILRGAAPAGSVLGELHAWVTAGALAAGEATMLAALLVEAGLPTVSDAIGNGLAALRTAAVDVPATVEEILRAHSPIQQFARYATRDVELGGAHIRAGQQVVLWYGAANRDPRVFAAPHAFAPRTPNPHVAFGAGPHRCLGARFARELLQTVVAAWGARVPAHHAAGARRPSSYQRGYGSLLVTL